jgi:hypothetical protein
MKKALWLLVLALATGLIATGCGGDDDDDDGGDDAPTKEEFVADANQVCEEGNTELDAAAEQVFGKDRPTAEDEGTFITETLVPNVQGQIDEIRDLGAPEGDEDEINGILEDAEAALSDLEANPTFEGGDPFADVNRRLADYGLTTCAGDDGE